MSILRNILSVLTSFNTILAVSAVIYCMNFEKRKYYLLRLLVVPIYIFFTTINVGTRAMGIDKVISMLYTPYINTFYIVNVLIVVGLLKFLYKEKTVSLLFMTIVAYTSEHIASHMKQLFAFWIQGNADTLPTLSLVLELPVAALIVAGTVLLLKRYYNSVQFLKNKYRFAFIIIALIAMMSVSSYVYTAVIFSIATNIYEIIIGVLLYFFLFRLFEYSQSQHDKEIIDRLLDEQLKQTKSYNENYEFINMKFHDLKKQVAGLVETSGDSEKLRAISDSIAMHETNLDTGNSYLNIVIRQYALICARKNIQLYCMIDGKSLDFMDEEDIYGIFNNALSNAVEATEKCGDGTYYISVNVRQNGNIVSVTVENCYDDKLVADGKLFSTTKSMRIGHGFGLKSIEYSVKKYEGNLNVSAEDGVFKLNIIFLR